MKNNVSGSGDSIFKKKGFFIALYSCMGAVMVLALVISFTNLTTSPNSETARQPDGAGESVNVEASRDESYLTKAEEDELAWKRPTPKPSATAAPNGTTTPAVTPRPAGTTTPSTPVVPIPSQTAPGATTKPTDDAASNGSEPVEETREVSTAATTGELAFTPFSESDKLIWPVYGDIAMVFSADKLVYDPTLNQYRTNDDLRISAQEGTPVKAAAEGKVIDVDSSLVYGQYVTIDHGNGWLATYGQLMDGVLVKEGEIVKTGQVIGGVGQPTGYGSLNGTHMNLRVTHDNEAVDPRDLLVEGQ